MQPPAVGVSVVILALGPEETASDCRDAMPSRLWLPLVRRVRQPFLGRWALPGGDLRADRSLEQSAYHALETTTDLHPRYLEQLYTFGDPARSHCGLPMVSIVYWALVGKAEAHDFTEADNVRWFPEDELPELAFDHRQIIDYALWRLRNKIEYPDIATKLVGDTFTLRHVRPTVFSFTQQATEPSFERLEVRELNHPALLRYLTHRVFDHSGHDRQLCGVGRGQLLSALPRLLQPV